MNPIDVPRPVRANGPGDSEVAALARGLAVLRAIADADRPLGNTELSAATGIPKPTVSRLAGTLLAGGHLRQEPGGERYWLGPTLLELGNLYLRRFDLRHRARMHFAPLADATGCSLHLGIRDRGDILVVDTIRSRFAVIASQTDVGSRMEITTSAAGRAYLALASADERAEVLSVLDLAPRTRRALERRLAESCDEYAHRGVAASFGEWHPQINALGTTLTGSRGELYAVSCGGPANLVSGEHLLNEVAPKLLAARAAILCEAGALPESERRRADR